MAARIAKLFRIDPITILKSNEFTWSVYVAASEIVYEDDRKEAERIRSKSKAR